MREVASNGLAFPALLGSRGGELPARYRWETQVAPGYPQTAFKIALPRDWRREEVGAGAKAVPGQPIRIGLFADNAEPHPAMVQVSCFPMHFEVGCSDFLRHQAEKMKVTLADGRLFPDGVSVAPDTIGWYGADANRHVARLVCRANSGIIYLLLGLAAVPRYAELKDDLALMLGSFTLLQNNSPGQLESWKLSQSVGPVFSVSHPASWPANVAGGPEGITLAPADTPNPIASTVIRIRAFQDMGDDQAAIAKLFVLAKEQIAQASMKFETDWTKDGDAPTLRTPGLLAACNAKLSAGPQAGEARAAVLRREGLTFLITAGYPAGSTDLSMWMRARRAYGIALRTCAAGSYLPQAS